MPEFVLPVQYLRQIAELVRLFGVDPEEWLTRSQLTLKQIDEASFQPSLDVFCHLTEDALLLTGEPALGLLLGERLVINTHGILGFAAQQSESLIQAIQLVQRYIALRTTLFDLEHEQDEVSQLEHIRFRANFALGTCERTLLEAVMLAVKNIFDAITLGCARPRQVNFPFSEPTYSHLTIDMFGCEVAYGQNWAGFTLDTVLLEQPLKMADPAAFREAEKICQQELGKLTAKTSTSAGVRRIMLEKQHGFPSLNVTARLFNLTPRTLHRRLLLEGTSFKEILEEVRHTLAVEHLKAGHLTMGEIAYTLGYTDLANFRRAFKRWTGIAPSYYLKHLPRTAGKTTE
ncbi:AraC family transcriptional regulator [Pseudomonas chengduensis]|nr:AraC family transcriptional regulator [Pseudomonas chengduensis]MDH1210526.1 AraC family transcriptional regulator [Pseudomonas chengduensis]